MLIKVLTGGKYLSILKQVRYQNVGYNVFTGDFAVVLDWKSSNVKV